LRSISSTRISVTLVRESIIRKPSLTRCLKSIIGVVRVLDHASAQTQHHRTVPLDQDPKRLRTDRIAAAPKALQQLAIGQTTECT
jgi:hypothetical protein